MSPRKPPPSEARTSREVVWTERALKHRRVVPELWRDEVREVFRKTYRIVYRVRERTIEILTVFEGHRRFPGGLLAGDEEP